MFYNKYLINYHCPLKSGIIQSSILDVNRTFWVSFFQRGSIPIRFLLDPKKLLPYYYFTCTFLICLAKTRLQWTRTFRIISRQNGCFQHFTRFQNDNKLYTKTPVAWYHFGYRCYHFSIGILQDTICWMHLKLPWK